MDEKFKIDMHIHSTFSDGTYTPEEIVDLAIKENLDLIALTDHNTIGGCKYFVSYAAKKNVNALCGIEISTTYKNEEIHLLAYFSSKTNFDLPEYKKLKDFFNLYQTHKKKQLTQIINNLKEDYPELSPDEFFDFALNLKRNSNLNRVHIANYLQEKKIVKSVDEAFGNLLSKQSKYYVENETIDLFEAIELVDKFDGLPVIAHPAQYKLSQEKLSKMLYEASLCCDTLGIEIFHFDCEKLDIIRFFNMGTSLQNILNFKSESSKKKIVFTAGSDFHGKNKINILGKPYNYELDGLVKEIYEKTCAEFVNFAKNKFNF